MHNLYKYRITVLYIWNKYCNSPILELKNFNEKKKISVAVHFKNSNWNGRGFTFQ